MRRGFTLIELMIVISVMAILMGIALPYFKGMQDEGNAAKCAGELRTLATAIESFNIHSSTGYPAQATLDIQFTDWQTTITDAKPTIVKVALMDPFDVSRQYSYAVSKIDGAKYYVVFSVGPDKAEGIEGLNDSDGALSGTIGDAIYISNGKDGNSF